MNKSARVIIKDVIARRQVQKQMMKELLILPIEDNIKLARQVLSGEKPMEHLMKHSETINKRITEALRK